MSVILAASKKSINICQMLSCSCHKTTGDPFGNARTVHSLTTWRPTTSTCHHSSTQPMEQMLNSNHFPKKRMLVNPILQKQDNWAIQPCKSVPSMGYRETTARDFLSTSLHMTRAWDQPEFIWFLCSINLWNQRASFSCSPPLTSDVASAEQQYPHKGTSASDIESPSQMLDDTSGLQPKSMSLPLRWFLMLGWRGTHRLTVSSWRIHSGAHAEYKWTSSKQKELKVMERKGHP